jgi:uncharacterized protein
MYHSRRDFLRRSSIFAAGFLSLRQFCNQNACAAPAHSVSPYGPLQDDLNGVLDLPPGFNYRVISVSGSPMSDGFITPGMPDGMSTFPGPDGLTIVVRNHELLPFEKPGPFGSSSELFSKIDAKKVYDCGEGKTPHMGGTTTFLYDTKNQKVVRDYLSLAGTARNCAGGPTPWNSWITCEESVVQKGPGADGDYTSERNHGYNFEVPASADIVLTEAVPLKDMGRFYHEAIAVDPTTGIVYQTEDREDGLIYRFLPSKSGQLSAGGKLQVLRFKEATSIDTRNWQEQTIEIGREYPVEWMDIDEVESPQDDLRYRGFDAGAARFARGEGMWYSERQVFFACTNGGKKQTGQIWRLNLEKPGLVQLDTLDLFIEENNSRIIEAADNLTIAPWGDVVICEDHENDARIIGITMQGELYPIARNHVQTEFAGVTFTPDGTTLLVNLQKRGMTVAITGPWQQRSVG